MKYINLDNESLINDENYKLAYELCHDIDKKGTPFVALTLELDGLLWTGDEELRKNLIAFIVNKSYPWSLVVVMDFLYVFGIKWLFIISLIKK